MARRNANLTGKSIQVTTSWRKYILCHFLAGVRSLERNDFKIYLALPC